MRYQTIAFIVFVAAAVLLKRFALSALRRRIPQDFIWASESAKKATLSAFGLWIVGMIVALSLALCLPYEWNWIGLIVAITSTISWPVLIEYRRARAASRRMNEVGQERQAGTPRS